MTLADDEEPRQPKGAEKQFALKLQGFLQSKLPERFFISIGKNLLYKLEVDVEGQLRPSDISNPIRGQFAFQTDLLIENVISRIPLVVVELKFGGFTTHDIITYSAKAVRHKEIYPYLRYGFVVGGTSKLSKRFLTHNQGVDFAMAAPDTDEGSLDVSNMVQRQIANAEMLVEVMRGTRTNFSSYEKNVDVRS